MTPEQEGKIDRCIGLVQNLSNHVLQAIQQQVDFGERLSKLEREAADAREFRERMRRKWHLLAQWVRRLGEEKPPAQGGPRPPLPSLSADDSGAIEIGALGASARFVGRAPVMVAIVLLVMIAGALVGAGAHAAFGHH